jgi:hypothetical protein
MYENMEKNVQSGLEDKKNMGLEFKNNIDMLSHFSQYGSLEIIAFLEQKINKNQFYLDNAKTYGNKIEGLLDNVYEKVSVNKANLENDPKELTKNELVNSLFKNFDSLSKGKSADQILTGNLKNIQANEVFIHKFASAVMGLVGIISHGGGFGISQLMSSNDMTENMLVDNGYSKPNKNEDKSVESVVKNILGDDQFEEHGKEAMEPFKKLQDSMTSVSDSIPSADAMPDMAGNAGNLAGGGGAAFDGMMGATPLLSFVGAAIKMADKAKDKGIDSMIGFKNLDMPMPKKSNKKS